MNKNKGKSENNRDYMDRID